MHCVKFNVLQRNSLKMHHIFSYWVPTYPCTLFSKLKGNECLFHQTKDGMLLHFMALGSCVLVNIFKNAIFECIGGV